MGAAAVPAGSSLECPPLIAPALSLQAESGRHLVLQCYYSKTAGSPLLAPLLNTFNDSLSVQVEKAQIACTEVEEESEMLHLHCTSEDMQTNIIC
jgi:hypothetical protein